jgi:hypothetical protein
MSVPTYASGYPLLSNLNAKFPSWDISANNLATKGYSVFGDRTGNVVTKYLGASLNTTNSFNYYETAVVGSVNCFGPSGGIFTTSTSVNTDVSGAYTGTYFSNSVSATRIAADNTANRPSQGLRGYIRYNTDINAIEIWNNYSNGWYTASTSGTSTYSQNLISYFTIGGTGSPAPTQTYLDPTGSYAVASPVIGGYILYNFSPTGITASSSGGSPSTATYTFVSTKSIPFSSIVVAGGGGGGGNWGGGGGAGGLLQSTGTFTAGQTYTLTIGGGGGRGDYNGNAPMIISIQGANSSISGTGVSITAIGGGLGGGPGGAQTTTRSYLDGGTGGSGGGGVGGIVSPSGPANWYTQGGTGTSGQGYYGGNSNNVSQNVPTTGYYGGGGGGGGAAGSGTSGCTLYDTVGSNTNIQITNPSYGGNGLPITGFGTGFGQLSGGLYYLAGGGGGGGGSGSGVPVNNGLGGLGGGGNGSGGSSGLTAGVSATSNTGGGGGGSSGGGFAGGYGGSGIILLRIPCYS